MAELEVYDGVAVAELARATGAARVYAFDVVESTMDVAHELARGGAAHGTVVLAEVQSAGRGRERREWLAPSGGVWLTLLLRHASVADLPVLPLRVGLAAAEALDQFTAERIGLKWPNDLFLGASKLGGVLTEARWRGDKLDWVAVGIGINTSAPEGINGAGLGADVRRRAVVERLVPSVLEAATRTGVLSNAEISAFAVRDIARGRVISSPIRGVVAGITRGGALQVRVNGGVKEVRSGSLVFAVQTQSLSANR